MLFRSFLYAPVTEGERVGRVQYLLDGQEIYSVPILAGEDLAVSEPPEPAGWEKFWETVKGWFR